MEKAIKAFKNHYIRPISTKIQQCVFMSTGRKRAWQLIFTSFSMDLRG